MPVVSSEVSSIPTAEMLAKTTDSWPSV